MGRENFRQGHVISLLIINAVALIDLSLFSIITSSFTIISATLLSVLFFRERLSRPQYTAAVLAVAAFIVSAL